MEYDEDEEDLLSLNLNDNDRRKRKRAQRSLTEINLMTNPSNNDFEAKVLKLLQMRDQMIRQDQALHNNKRRLVSQNPNGLRLIHLLLVAATASAKSDPADAALENLSSLYAGASFIGDSVQRVVAHFADGLTARLLTRNSPFFDVIVKPPTLEDELSAFVAFYRASPFHQFAHFTANQAIVEAFERGDEHGEEHESSALHVIDFDVSYGFQWPSLIQSLAEKASDEGRNISLRITGLGRSRGELTETENRLVGFSRAFRNLSFEFNGCENSVELLNLITRHCKRQRHEKIAVNFPFPSSENTSKTLRLVRSALCPSVVVVVERESTASKSSFLARFMDSLHYFAAIFDSLDDCLPRESAERLRVEKSLLGREIKTSVIGVDGNGERLESLKERMRRHGFEGMGVSSKAVIQAKLLVKMRAHGFPDEEINGGFRVMEREEGMAISLAWQNRCLITASVWRSMPL